MLPATLPIASIQSCTVALRAETCNKLPSSLYKSETLAFSRHSRLLEGADFTQVFKRNRRYTNQLWIMLVHRKAAGDPRLGLAIAKKRAKRAVDRNRIKRIARESFRHQQAMLGPVDIVLMNKDAARSATMVELRKTLDSLWKELPMTGATSGSRDKSTR